MDRDSGPMDKAEEHFQQGEAFRNEIDEILEDANEQVDDDDEAGKRSTTITPDAAEHFDAEPRPLGYGAPLGYSANPPKLRGMPSTMGLPQATLMLEKIRIGLKQYISPAVLDQMKFGATYDPVTDKIMMELGMYLFSNKIHTETTKGDYPAGWFQGFKDAHFPGWLKRKFPVKYTQFFEEVKTIHICPHLNYRTPDEERYHLQFLMPEGDLTRIQS